MAKSNLEEAFQGMEAQGGLLHLNIKTKLEIGTLLALIFLGSFALAVILHEGTHLLLSNKALGICVGFCGEYTPALAYANKNEFSEAELLPTFVGFFAFGISAIFGCVVLRRLYLRQDKKS